jgi:uncharacterized protein with PIN domain
MKVLENNNKEKSWKIVCPHCNSVLEYNKKDVISKESYFFYMHCIICPCCGKYVDVKHW